MRKLANIQNYPYLKQVLPTDLLHPLLIQALEARNITHLTDLQHKALPSLLGGKNCLLLGEPSSGKTLAYMLPILQNLYELGLQDHRYIMNEANETEMFNNADDIYFQNKKNKTDEFAPIKGALIMTQSKEGANQIYAEGRVLDITNNVRFNRLYSSLQIKSPIVEHITPDKNPVDGKPPKEYDDKEMFEISMSNLTNNASWQHCDVIVSTPLVTATTLKRRNAFAPHSVNPKQIVIDECDILLGSLDINKKVVDILRKFGGKRGSFAKDN
jgi:superfamily II DNA/RNA helicase